MPKRSIIWPILLIIVICTASGRNDFAAPDPGFSYDKIAHFLVFGLVATSIVRIPALFARGWIGGLVTVLLVSGFGGFDEFRQSFTPGRSVELADWMADTAGATLATFLYLAAPQYRRFLEWRPFAVKPPSGPPDPATQENIPRENES